MLRICIAFILSVTIQGAPEGYIYNGSAAVLDHRKPNEFQQGRFNGIPCTHTSHSIGDNSGAAKHIIQAQSVGRIINQQHNPKEYHNLETAASNINTHSKAVTVNSHIIVGDRGTAYPSSSIGKSEVYPTAPQGLEYFNSGLSSSSVDSSAFSQHAQQSSKFNTLSKLTSQISTPSFNPANLVPGNVVPSQVLSGQVQDYSYNAELASSTNQNIQHSYAPSNFHHTTKPHILLPPANNIFLPSYNPTQLTSPGHNGNLEGPRPAQPFTNGNHIVSTIYQNGHGSYAGSFNHNTFGHSQGPIGHSNFGGQRYSSSGSNQNYQSSNILSDASTSSSNILKGQLGQVIRETFANAPLDPHVEKHIYVHVPPEDLEEKGNDQTLQLLPQVQPKKHYKIIFIKAPTVEPSNYVQLAANQLAAQQVEEKTLVYVLVKKPEEPSLEEIQQIQQPVFKTSKPEVYFIKYKTRKDGEGQGPFHTGKSVSNYNALNQLTTADITSTSDITLKNQSPQPSESYHTNNFTPTSGIDIRFTGGESGSVSTSNSYTTSSSASSASSASSLDNGPKHELYGVPLE